jgi:FixJ family two-component response regulator
LSTSHLQVQQPLVVGRAAGPIHIVVTDVVMPGLGGREMVERLRLTRPDLKVLFTSGYTDDAIVRHGVLRSGVTFLQKPFTRDGLISKVRQALRAP